MLFLQREEGQGMVEYGLVLGLFALVGTLILLSSQIVIVAKTIVDSLI